MRHEYESEMSPYGLALPKVIELECNSLVFILLLWCAKTNAQTSNGYTASQLSPDLDLVSRERILFGNGVDDNAPSEDDDSGGIVMTE